MGRLKRIMATLAAAVILVSCGNPLYQGLVEVYTDYASPRFITSYYEPGIDAETAIVLDFSETIDPATVSLTINTTDTYSTQWSSWRMSYDRLTITPDTTWRLGSGLTVSITCEDLEGFDMDSSRTYGVLDDTVYVHAVTGSSSNPGTSDLPKLTIRSGVGLAGDLALVDEVHVAEGTYSSGTTITIDEPIKVYGGYSSSDWETRESNADWALDENPQYPTTVKMIYTSYGSPYEQPSAFYVSGVDTGTAEIDGFDIDAGTGQNSVGITVYGSNAKIASCDIYGGTGLSSIGVVAYGADLEVSRCMISGGENDISTGIFNYVSAADILYNDIEGGTGENVKGILNIGADSTTLIEGNYIRGGSGRESVEGIGNEVESDVTIRNNVIFAGTSMGLDTMGIRNKTSSPTIRNNLIHGGGAPELGYDGIATGIWNLSAANPVIQNNIFIIESGFYRYGVCDDDIESQPASLENNCFLDCDTALYLDLSGSGYDIDNVTDLNNLSFADGNISDVSLAATLDAIFINPEEPDRDYHLEATAPVNVREGGLDFSSTFTGDLETTARTAGATTATNSSAAGWSMGPFEED